MLDEKLVVVFLNESAESLLNTSLRRADGKLLAGLIRDGETLLGACQRVILGGGQVRLRNHEVVLFPSLSKKRMDCTINWIHCQSGGRLLLEMQQIQPIGPHVLDEELLHRQQSNQAVIRGMAHEIRNPLGGIRGAAQLLADEAGSEAFADYTAIILQETDRLAKLVDRMQARTRANLDEPVNIHRVVEHVRKLLEAEEGGSVQFLQNYDPSLPRVRGNRDLLVQALLNVMRNAVEALTEQTGEKCIVVHTRIDHLAFLDGSRQVVRVDVEDNGPGIASGMETRIFDPMVTDKTNGTGMGLAITAEIITQHGGGIDCVSKPGKTVFRVYLPTIREWHH